MHSPSSSNASSSGAAGSAEEPRQHSPNVTSPAPPTATVPSLHFGASGPRPPPPPAEHRAGAGGGSPPPQSSSSAPLVAEEKSWPHTGSTAHAMGTSTPLTALSGVSPPVLRRPASLFDSPLSTEALFLRLQEHEQQQQQRARDVGPATAPSPAIDSEPPARRASVPITSVLGRPPTAPPASPTPAASPSGEANAFAYLASQRERSLSSFRPPLRSASPTSTVDYADIERKQNELRYTVEHRIHSLEHTVALRDEEVATLSSRLRKLEEDYQFNYNLIAERDAALEEAAAQLQRLYRELKRLTEEAARTGKKAEAAEAELRAARQRVREVEEERDTAVRQVQKDYTVKERHLFEGVRAKEAALEQEQAEQHQWYKAQLKALEEERTMLADRSASISLEAEERCRQQVGRLQTELTEAQRELKAVRQAKAEDERQIALLTDAKAGLLHDAAVHQQHCEAAREELTLAKKEVEERLARVVAEGEKRCTAAEAVTRDEQARASRLELERTRLQATLAEAQERLQHLTARYEDDIARYTKERQVLLRRNDEAAAATAQVEQSLQDTQRELEKQRRLAAEEAERLGKELERARHSQDAARQELAAVKDKCEQAEAAVTRLEEEVRRWKSEEDKTATSGRQERSAWEERCRQAERRLQLMEEEAQQSRKAQQSAVERAQTEAGRLTRELHASEAARRTLEDQLHLLDDAREERAATQALRAEREHLQRRVAELERTNEEVRQQVAAFTAELQNDPIIAAAKASQQRIVDLEQELAAARAEQQLLRDTVREKEDEVVRHQTEMLRVQVLMGDGTPTALNDGSSSGGSGAVALSEQVSRALQRQQQQMRSEYSKMRESYEEMVRELDRQRRHRTRRAAPAPRSPSSASSSSSTSSSVTPEHRREHRSAKCASRSGERASAAAAAPLPPVLPDSKAAHLMQEMEVWRQRCVQLEQQLHAALVERDRLRREVQLAKQDVVALGAEKQSLIDLNSLLKVQLREAYRMRIGDGHTRPSPPTAAAATVQPASPATVRVSPELLAAALQALEDAGHGGAPPSTPLRSHQTEAYATTPSGGTPVVHSTRGSAAKGDRASQAAQERLAALEKEINDVRGQLSATQSNSSSRQPVVRRGTAAVRHYGFGS